MLVLSGLKIEHSARASLSDFFELPQVVLYVLGTF